MTSSTGSRSGATTTSLLTVVGVALVVVGAVAWLRQPDPAPLESHGTAGTPAQTGSAAPEQSVVSAPLPMEQRARWRPGAPERLEIPALDIDAPVVPIAAPGGVLTPPSDPQTLGWWADGAPPGARRGSALVTGHTVSSGGGAMDDLERLSVGARVWMRTERGRIGYEVRDVVILGKGELARRAPEVFDQEVAGRLVLITCEDWNGVEYLSNVVVTAAPVA